MHRLFLNEAIFDLDLQPHSPLLIKSGEAGEVGLDPLLPDMNFVRTRRPDRGEEVYVPGSSLRGVLRSYAERLLRSVKPDLACNPLQFRPGGGPRDLRPCCITDSELRRHTQTRADRLNGAEAYRYSCYGCRLFGNNALASRVRVGDFYLTSTPTFEVRHGVAIDRVTGAVAQGPFEMELLTDGTLAGSVGIRNFTLGQFGLMSAALLDLADGLVPIGYGKSRGLGRLRVTFRRLTVRTLKDPEGQLRGASTLSSPQQRQEYDLPLAEQDRLDLQTQARPERGYWVVQAEGGEARSWLEKAAPCWNREVSR
jgi:CRISPR/Cas system CSM-associated protein Csm3 (group 7 of RAMP superfamily)